MVIERSYHEILQIAIWASGIRLANRFRHARLTATGACDTPTHAGITQKGTAAVDRVADSVGRPCRFTSPIDCVRPEPRRRPGSPGTVVPPRRRRLSLSPVTTVAGDDKPYLPDRGTNGCDKPGWCSGPSYDPVTVVTRVQIPLRASDFDLIPAPKGEPADSQSLDQPWATSKSGTRLAQIDDGWVYRKGRTVSTPSRSSPSKRVSSLLLTSTRAVVPPFRDDRRGRLDSEQKL